MSSISSVPAVPAGSQISPVDQVLYHQSNLIGDWKGSWTKTGGAIELDVVSINNGLATVKYTHNGYTERGTATVSQNTITYGDVTLGTRDGQNAALEFAAGTATQSAILTKSASTANQNPLAGNWIGSNATGSVAIEVQSISGRNAQIQYSIMGQTGQGTGDVYAHAVDLGNVLVSSTDGVTGTVTYTVGQQTLSLAIKKYTPPTTTTSSSSATSTSSVNLLA
jgi:hypothetical protein